jgi:hypothetical protein
VKDFGQLKFNDGPRWARRLRNVGVTIALVNFFAFVVIALSIGGDAWNGKVEDGQHYLGSKSEYTPVSRAVWMYSRLHVLSLIVTHPLGALSGLIWIFAAESCPREPRTDAAA